MDHSQGRNGARYHAPRGNHGTLADGHVRQDDDSGADIGLIIDSYGDISLPFAGLWRETMYVGEDEHADADLDSVADRYPVGIRIIDNDIAADADVGADPYSSPSVERDP